MHNKGELIHHGIVRVSRKRLYHIHAISFTGSLLHTVHSVKNVNSDDVGVSLLSVGSQSH